MPDGSDKLRHVFDQFRDYDRQRTAALLNQQRRRTSGQVAGKDADNPMDEGAPVAARPSQSS
ncbi:MAG: hypothetical protein AAFU65_02580 [Pseudomonadota bacterium]